MVVRIIVFLFFLPLVCFSQQSFDALRKVWKNENLADSVRFGAIQRYYDSNNPDFNENLKLTEYHYNLAQQKKSNPEKLIALHQRAKYYYMLGNVAIFFVTFIR